jgi:hypothetical protein
VHGIRSRKLVVDLRRLRPRRQAFAQVLKVNYPAHERMRLELAKIVLRHD